MGVALNITGQKFGNLTAIKRTEKYSKTDGVIWLFKCDCGKEAYVPVHCVKSGNTKSCGCLKIKSARAQGKRKRKHGEIKTRLYRIWSNMKSRCTLESKDSYQWYGERGITFCDEWKDFINFRDWAISNGYTDELTLDRIDGSGNYEPSNCRWISQKEQCRNRKSNHHVLLNGEEMLLSDAAQIVGKSHSCLIRWIKNGNVDVVGSNGKTYSLQNTEQKTYERRVRNATLEGIL